MRCNVRKFANELKEKGLVAEVEVADERDEDNNRFWVSFSPESQNEFILTDGFYRKHAYQDKPRNIVYEILGGATYVLIITREFGRWAIKYAYFPRIDELRVESLVPEMRNFNDYSTLPHEELEQFLSSLSRLKH